MQFRSWHLFLHCQSTTFGLLTFALVIKHSPSLNPLMSLALVYAWILQGLMFCSAISSVVYDFIDVYGESIEEVAIELGMTKGKVANLYEAFKATEKYGKRYPDDKNYVTKFSYFMELFQSRVLKNWLSEDPTNLDYFIELVRNNKLEATYKGPRKLAKIIAIPNPLRAKALAELDAEDGDIEKAYSVVTDYQKSSSGVWSDIKKLRSVFDKTRYDEFILAVEDPEKFELLEEIIEKTMKMKDEIVLLRTRGEKV